MRETDYSSSTLTAIKKAKSVAYREKYITYGVSHLVTTLIKKWKK